MTDPIRELRAYAAAQEAAIPTRVGRRVAARLLSRGPELRVRRSVVALATTGALVFGNGAVALAANSSVPGDLLYPADRAYEAVTDLLGVGGDHIDERLAEADEVLRRGDSESAYLLVLEVLEGFDARPVAPGGAPEDVAALVATARQIRDVARADPHAAREAAQNLGRRAGHTLPAGQPETTPAVTAPGRTDPGGPPDEGLSPSETAPGRQGKERGSGNQGGNSRTAPGQEKKSGQGSAP